MPSRLRTRRTTSKPGTLSIVNQTTGEVLYSETRYAETRFERMLDTVGNRNGVNPLDATLAFNEVAPLNGKQSGNTPFIFHNYIPDAFLGYVDHIGGVLGTDLSDYTILARSSPSRPIVDLPVFVLEMRDLPKLVQLAGNSLLQKGASANLSWQFGWRPLLSDLSKMLDFTDHVNKRMREIRSLYDKRGLSRTVQGDFVTGKDEGLATINSYPSVQGRYQRVTTWRRWYSVRWKPYGVPPITFADLHTQAVRSALGLHLTPSTIWEATPWSWLVDWFGNVGDYLMAYRNTVPAYAVDICRMTQMETHEQISRTSLSWNTGGTGRRTKITKTRVIGAEIPGTSNQGFQFLSLGKLSILGSLAVLRHRGA